MGTFLVVLGILFALFVVPFAWPLFDTLCEESARKKARLAWERQIDHEARTLGLTQESPGRWRGTVAGCAVQVQLPDREMEFSVRATLPEKLPFTLYIPSYSQTRQDEVTGGGFTGAHPRTLREKLVDGTPVGDKRVVTETGQEAVVRDLFASDLGRDLARFLEFSESWVDGGALGTANALLAYGTPEAPRGPVLGEVPSMVELPVPHPRLRPDPPRQGRDLRRLAQRLRSIAVRVGGC
ncbi:MAG: hypothetical protein QM765_37185 [Myxococcales bacterium]